MTHKRLVNAIEKLGIKVDAQEGSQKRFYASNDKYICSWFLSESGLATCVKLRRHDDHDDMMSDYFAGFFARKIQTVVDFLGKENPWERNERKQVA